MTRKLFLGFIAIAAVSLWFVGCSEEERLVPVDEQPPVLTRLDAWPDDNVVCGPLDITGNVTDEAQTGVDPTGVAKIWVTLNGTEIASFTPAADCPVSVEFEFMDLELSGDGSLKLHAEDCEGNVTVFRNTTVDVFDDVLPVVTWVNPTEGEIIYGTSWIFEVTVVSDNEVLDVCLTIDGIDVGCDDSAPFKWLVSDLGEGLHIASATATDGCGYYGSTEVSFEVILCEGDPPAVTWVSPANEGDILYPGNFIQVALDRETETVEVCLDIDGVLVSCDLSAPYKWLIPGGLDEGIHLLSVTATDECGLFTITDSSFEFVLCQGEAPVVTFVVPAEEGDVLYPGDFIEVAFDRDSAGLTACLEIDGILIGCDATAPYKWPVPALTEGDHTASISATDGCGLEGYGDIIFEFDLCADNVAPVVSITDPGAFECMPHNIFATVTDDIGLVDVWAEVGMTTIPGINTTGDEYKFHVTTGLVIGPNTITVYADDACGNVGDDDVSFNFSCPDPIVWITAPAPDSLLCGMFTFKAETGFDRELPEFTRVEFYIDGELVHTDTEGPEWTYDVNVNTFEPGSHLVSARARVTDMDGVHTWYPSETVNWIKTCDPVAVLELDEDFSDPINECMRCVNLSAEHSSDDNTEPAMTYTFTCLTTENYVVTQSAPTDPTVKICITDEPFGYGDYTFHLLVTDGWGLTDEMDIVVPFADICTDMIAITYPDPADDCPVFGDFEASWALTATATDRDLTEPYVDTVDFYYDSTMYYLDGPWICQDDEGADNVWTCDWMSENLPAAGGWYYAHAMSTDWAGNELWATSVPFYKSDRPVVGDLIMPPVSLSYLWEHVDGNVYGNTIGTHSFHVAWTDDNLGIPDTTYEIFWDLGCDGVYEASGLMMNEWSHEFTEFGNYSLCVKIEETTPCGDIVTSLTEEWYICLEEDDPIITAFDVENLIFDVDEGPYCNLWINPRTDLVSEQGTGAENILFAADDDFETDFCVSECDYYVLHFTHASAYPITITAPDILCGDTVYDVDWDDFAPGEWLVTFTIFDKAGNSASASETVIKSDFPTITGAPCDEFGPLPDMFSNQIGWDPDEWSCYLDPVGVPVDFNDWSGWDDNDGIVDTMVVEFVWDDSNGVSNEELTCPPERDHVEEIWGYNCATFSLPWMHHVPDYGHHWVRFWACDQYGMWSKSEWIPVEVEDHCAPDWLFELVIESVKGSNVDPELVDWDRIDVLSALDIDFCIKELVEDREVPFNDHGIAKIWFKPFNVYEGFDVDGNELIEGAELTYWTDTYGALPLDGSLGDGSSSCTGPGYEYLAYIDGGFNTCTNNTGAWDANTSPWYGCCGFFYVYAIAEDTNGNFSMPSAPVVVFKYSEPNLSFPDCDIAAVDEVITLPVELDFECSDAIETITYSWDFDDGSFAETTEPTVDHSWSAPGYYEVYCTVTIEDANGLHIDTAMTCISVADTDDPLVTNLDIETTDNNANICNEGYFNAQYGLMYYTASAADINGILQGPGGLNDWTVEVKLWTDDDGLMGGTFGTEIELVAELTNPDCCDNEVDWIFTYDWVGKDRGYYWMIATCRDRSGNYMGEDTPDPTDDYYAIQLFHSDPPTIAVNCLYTDMNTLRFNIRYDCLTITDDAPLSIDTKTQWDQTMPTNGYRWYQRGYYDDHCPDCAWCSDGNPYGDSNFDFDHEFDWTDNQDIDNIWLDYFNSGDGYGCYDDDFDNIDTKDDNPAAVRAVDEDGIYSDVILFNVCIEDIYEPCVEWQEPLCEVIDGTTDLVVWASDYPEFTDRGEMPCIDHVDFFINDFYAGTDNSGEDVPGTHVMCENETSEIWEFSLDGFDVSAFLDSVYGIDPMAACGWGGEIELMARAYDCDEDQTGDALIWVCESNSPVLMDTVDPCVWAFDQFNVIVDFTPYFCDDNMIDYIWVDWDDGSPLEQVLWANAGSVSHDYTSGGEGCYDIEVDVYDEYSEANDCCPGSPAGPHLEDAVVGSILIDMTDPVVDIGDMLPMHDSECVTVDPGNNIEIIITDITDVDSDNCYGAAQIDWVKFWLSDDDWTNKEYLGIDTDGTDGWSKFWNPWNQEAKQIWVGIEVQDCAGNSVEFWMIPDAGEYWFYKDLKAWDPLIDQHEVWALVGAPTAYALPFEGEGDNDPSDPIFFSWFWDGDISDCPTAADWTGETISISPGNDVGAVPGDYILVLALEDENEAGYGGGSCFLYCDATANADTAIIHLCADDEGPTIVLDSPDPVDDVEGRDFEFCFTVDDCFFWEDGMVSVVSNPEADTLYTFFYQSNHQWQPEWAPHYSYVSPNGPEQFCFSFPTGGTDCVYTDVHGDTLTYNPFFDGDIFDLLIEATDYHPTAPNTTNENNTFTIDDVLGPEAPATAEWWIYPTPNAVIPAGQPIVVQVMPYDWHCADIGKVLFYSNEYAYELEDADPDNEFGDDTDIDGDGIFTATTVLAVGNHTIGIFAVDEHGNWSNQWFINVTVAPAP